MTRRRSAFVAAALTAALAFGVGGCGAGAAGNELPPGAVPVEPAPSTTVTPAIGATEGLVSTALGARGLPVAAAEVPYRPAEAPTLAAAPRAVYQVKLPDDLTHGFYVIYGLPSPQAATAAAREQVAFVESGPGRVQFPADARFVLRQVDSTLVFYTWAPSAVTDARSPQIADAIATVGTGYEIRG